MVQVSLRWGGTTQPLHPIEAEWVVGGFELNAALFGLFLDVLTRFDLCMRNWSQRIRHIGRK